MRSRKIFSKLFGAALMALIIAASGCYSTRVVAIHPPQPGKAPAPSEPATETTMDVDFFAWGLLQKPDSPIYADCVSNALRQVTVTTRPGFAVLTVLTLGFWSRKQVEWECAKTPPPKPAPIGGDMPNGEDLAHAAR